MKAIQFRKIDALLIKLSLNGKFWVVCSMVTAITLTIALLNLNAANNQLHAGSAARVQASVDAYAKVASQMGLSGEALARFAQDNSLRLASRDEQSRRGDSVTASAPVAGQYLQLSQDVAAWEAEGKSDAWWMLWVALIALYPLYQLSYWISTSLGGGLWDMYIAIKRLADGDLSFRLNFFGKDDFSLIAREIDRNADNMSEMVKAIGNNARTLANASDEFNLQAKQNDELAQFQHQFLDTVAVAMDQMTAAIEEVSHNAANTSDHTKHNATAAADSKQRIAEAVRRIGQLTGQIDAASSAVDQLSGNATEIGAVVTTINGISEQTNLLALNAAIEAARAGEQGRGFAVVADEVRTLAGRTQQATVEIQSMIEGLQSGSGQLADITHEIVEQAELGRAAIESVGSDVDTMADSIDQVFDMSSQIAASAEEQSVSARDIASQLNEIRDQSQTIKETAERSVVLASELQQSSTELDGILSQYRLQ
ncbi:methyl-accepting chemotaxis protein [Shewanella loihica]|uniref:Methyl-accepting chemotaxis sensory transducer n=1 Tax=Shewanella loihica (strain ATCC BAA-1088 / PV-4) TaxID=323850 RepID=A3QF81_SHELP|nr:methyl-accepting chemotaxis protein [Shewanella loihica]ABO24129.1 methyl-accepting chemotaxis sensory transducer [Shewanella loihica PV-4]